MMSTGQTPFDILGVTPADDMTTIRMVWRAQVRKLHPDVVGNTASASSRLAEVNAAFDALQGHEPSLTAKAEKVAEVDRVAREAVLRAKQVARQDAEARRRKDAIDAQRRLAELKRAKAAVLKERLKGHIGTVHAKAANGYAAARKILAA